MKISDNTAISMPMRNLLSILGAVAVGVWAYFGVIERINSIENDNVLIKKDLDQAVEFSIKWPRGELGSLPADSEQFLLIESLLSDVEYIQLEIKESRHNAVNIKRLQQDVDKILAAIETTAIVAMIEVVVALLMIVNNEIKEHRIQDSMSACLKGKRVASRVYNKNVQYQCIKSKAETEIYLGEKSIKKLILD
jgi:hypothetical protein